MKTLIIITLMALNAAAQVIVGTNTVYISFPANVNSQPDKDFISSELTKVFAFAKNINIAFATTSVPEQFKLKSYAAPSPFPDFVDKGSISLSFSNEMFTAKLNEKFAAKFLAAKEFSQTNSALLGKFDEIVTIFNNGSVTNMNVAAQKEIFWMPTYY